MIVRCDPSRRLLLGAALDSRRPGVRRASRRSPSPPRPGRLPKDVVPVEYALHIVPDVAARSFRGTGSYRIEVLQPTRRIVLHALEIEVVSAALARPGPAA